MRRAALFALAAAALVPAGCTRHPVGQVVAVVDSDEITRAELNAELRTGQDRGPGALRAALDRLIDRRLLARAAREQALDRSQDYLIRSRQLGDALLVQMLREQAGQALPVPPDAAIDDFLRSHPEIRGSRPDDAARSLAASLLRDRQLDQVMRRELAAVRARARIAYQPAAAAAPGAPPS